MPDDPMPPHVRVTLPDGQDLIAHLHERRQWPRGGWMYQVSIPVWANTGDESIEAREFRVWLTPGEQVHPLDGVSYAHVPTHPLPEPESEPGPDPNRWAFKAQKLRPPAGRSSPGGVVVHIWDCPDAPAGDPEIDLYEALDMMRTVTGAVLCKECGASVALGPLLDP